MGVIFLFYTESEAVGGALSTAHAVPWLDQLAYMYGGTLACIHPEGAGYPASAAEQYPTLAAAQAAYPMHTWVYLDPDAPLYLDTLVHPIDNVVYAVGHDATGYAGEALNGLAYKVRTTQPEPFVGHAAVALAGAMVDRWYRALPWP